MFTRLLVGLDGSIGADAALTAAMDLGRRFRSTILLAAITEPGAGAADRAVRLTDAAATRVTDAGLGVEIQHASGTVDDELLRLAEQADAIVIGRRGEAHGAPGSLGAVTSRVVKKSPKPVVVAGETASLFQRPAIAYDGGTTSTSALTLAARYAEAAQVPLDVIHVSDDAHAGDLLAKAGAWLSTEHVLFTTHLLRGRLSQALPAHLSSAGIDLLVVGAHGGRRRRSWSVGSHAEMLIRATVIPVIVIR
jgi:nucleotide-binding universal stress UspA family protein